MGFYLYFYKVALMYSIVSTLVLYFDGVFSAILYLQFGVVESRNEYCSLHVRKFHPRMLMTQHFLLPERLYDPWELFKRLSYCFSFVSHWLAPPLNTFGLIDYFFFKAV